MKTAGIRPDDIVRCDVRGQHFYARVVEKHSALGGSFRANKTEVEPLLDTNRIPTSYVTSRQIIEHYSKRKGTRNGKSEGTQDEG